LKNPAVNTSLMQRMNRIKVLRYIKENPGSARCTISEATGLSLGAVTNLTSYLLSKGFVSEGGAISEDRVGRKRIKLKINGSTRKIFCIMIDTCQVNIYLTNLEGKILSEHIKKTKDKTLEETVSYICKYIKDSSENITAVGVSLSALVLDRGTKVISSSMKFENTNIRKIIEDETGYPVFVDNISISKALGFIKKNPSLRNERVLFADMDGGFGGVYINRGEVMRRIPCEIGHTTVNPDGNKCFCGNRGCLELMLTEATSEKERNEYTGIGLASLVNLFAPTVLVVNKSSDINEEAVLNTIRERAYPVLCDELKTVFTDADEKTVLEGIADNLWDYIFSIDFENPLI